MNETMSNLSEEEEKKGRGLNPGPIVAAFLVLAALIIIGTLFLKNKEKNEPPLADKTTQKSIDKKQPPPTRPVVEEKKATHPPKPIVKRKTQPKQPAKKPIKRKTYKKRITKKRAKSSEQPPKPVITSPAPKQPAQEEVALVVPPSKPEEEVEAYKPEDLPMPSKPKLTPEIKEPISLPESTIPKKESQSNPFLSAMQAYKSKKYAEAAMAFKKIPKPATKQRGDQSREEYVKANFFRGLSLQKQGKLKSAIKSYKTVLEYERFYPICEMNLGICYMGLKQYAKADRAFKNVVRDQNRISPEQYDDIMQRTRYFWALTWTKLFKESKNQDKKLYFRKQASLKWSNYQAWFGKNKKYATANAKAENYIRSINIR